MNIKTRFFYVTFAMLVVLMLLLAVGAGAARAELQPQVRGAAVKTSMIQKELVSRSETRIHPLNSIPGLTQQAGEFFNPKRLVQGVSNDKLVFGGTYILNSGEVLDGNLIVFGGVAKIEQGATVEDDMVLIGGTGEINGAINGDVIVLGGLLILGPTAVVEKDVSVIGGHLDQNPGAEVYGTITTGIEGPFSVTVPGDITIPIPGGENFPKIEVMTNPFWEGLWVLFRSLFMAALAVLAVLFIPKPTERIGEVAIKQTPVSGGVGCLTLVILPILLVITAITIIGIPITILLSILFVLVAILGVISLGTETGKRLAVMLKTDWALAVSAGVGTFLLWLVVEGLNWIIPCVGGIPMFLVSLVGIGAVVLTRLGSRDYPYYETSHPAPLNSSQSSAIQSGGISEVSPEPDSDTPTGGDDSDQPG